MDTTQSLSAPPLDDLATPAMDKFVSRVKSLYSLPAVAVEVLELTSHPQIDTRALKECIERDPALTVRILRVVNSSLFGLSHPVGNLSQAITMLGIKPLKLLVLGFSLPERLFADLAREQLQWYWSTTLVRAVAAREISEQFFKQPGDEAFLAGLLQDIGILVLLGQLRGSYSRFLSGAMENETDLSQLETEALGFDHLALSISLLKQWRMPVPLQKAISNVRKREIHAGGETSTDHLTRVLQLANLFGELVGRNRLCVLPELLELGEVYCDLDKPHLSQMVAELQPKVEQLAEVLSLELPGDRMYTDILSAAHDQMLALENEEKASTHQSIPEEAKIESLVLKEATRLRFAVNSFLRGATPKALEPTTKCDEVGAVAPAPQDVALERSLSKPSFVFDNSFEQRLVFAVGNCRSERIPLSIVMLEVALENSSHGEKEPLLNKLLDTACREVFTSPMDLEIHNLTRRTLILSGCDRHDAVRMARGAISSIETSFQRQSPHTQEQRILVRLGVASVALPSRNFESSRLLQTADRCLSATRNSGISSVKSLEIY